MNCGLGNLAKLKAHLLPAGTLAGEVKFDEVIADLGKQVAGLMEQACGRKFGRMVGDMAIFQADRASFVLPRYPVESVTAVELDSGEGYEAQDLGLIASTSLASGVIYLAGGDPGDYRARVRFTYTGGYWFETLEPDEDGYPQTKPESAAGLPSELLGAWLTQCRHVWSRFDKLGTGIVSKPDAQSLLADLELVPLVKRTLAGYTTMRPI